jgi:bacteriocin-like protein
MSDQEKKQETSITPQPGAENTESGELSEEELKKVSGGITHGDITVSKPIDAASPKLFQG